MVDLNPQILKKGAKKEFVVLTYDEYMALQEYLEDMEDLLDLRAAKKQEGNVKSVPLDDANRELGFS